MRRIHWFEFTDLSWYPETFRRIQTDYLQFVATRGSGQKNLAPLITKAMQQAGTTEITDLCSGGTGILARTAAALGRGRMAGERQADGQVHPCQSRGTLARRD